MSSTAMSSTVMSSTAMSSTAMSSTAMSASARSSAVLAGPAAGRPAAAGRRHLANDAWEALLSAHAALVKRFAAEDTWAEVSMREYDVLYTLSKCPEPVRLSELNRHVLLSQPALSRLVDRLAERGLVQRCADPADGRGVRLVLTEAGRARQRQVGQGHARSVARSLTAALTPGELRQLETICAKLAAPAPAGPACHDDDEDLH
jgi:DNA-binding MarR family transcriptional regulator